MKKYLFLALLFSAFGFSQNGISYQALILNPAGEEIPGQNNPHAPISSKLVCLKFAIIDHTNQIEYSETHKVSTDAYGIVNLVIGTGEQIGGYASTFSDIVWGNKPKSLKVDLDVSAVCSNYVEISNQPFTYIPFAYYAINSGSSTGSQGPQGLTGATGATGSQGPAGTNGTNGTNGSSAYQLAVLNGFVGTQAQWLASLVGSQGPQGIQGLTGATGTTGAQGPAGTNGTNGSSAYQLAVLNGFVGTEAQWLASLVGAQGPQGIQGLTGATGAQGSQGIQGLTGATGPQGPAGTNATVTGTAPIDVTSGIVSITDSGITTAKLADNSVTIAKLPVGATTTTFLRGDGTWVTPTDTNTTYIAGQGLTLSGSTFAANDATTSTKGIVQLSGDLNGTASSVIVSKIQGNSVSAVAPTDGQILIWNAVTSSWIPSAPTRPILNIKNVTTNDYTVELTDDIIYRNITSAGTLTFPNTLPAGRVFHLVNLSLLNDWTLSPTPLNTTNVYIAAGSSMTVVTLGDGNIMVTTGY